MIMDKEEIKILIGQLKYLNKKYVSKVEIINEYISILDRFTWEIDDASTIDNFREINRYIIYEINEFLLKEEL